MFVGHMYRLIDKGVGWARLACWHRVNNNLTMLLRGKISCPLLSSLHDRVPFVGPPTHGNDAPKFCPNSAAKFFRRWGGWNGQYARHEYTTGFLVGMGVLLGVYLILCGIFSLVFPTSSVLSRIRRTTNVDRQILHTCLDWYLTFPLFGPLLREAGS